MPDEIEKDPMFAKGYKQGYTEGTVDAFDNLSKIATNTLQYPDAGNNLSYPLFGISSVQGKMASEALRVVREEGVLSSARRMQMIDHASELLGFVIILCIELRIPFGVIVRTMIADLEKKQQSSTGG